MFLNFLLLVCLCLVNVTEAKILVMTHVFNRPDFIELQYRCLQKFLLDDYEYIVFNDAINPKISKTIKEKCHKLGIQCIPIPQQIHSHLYPLRLPQDRFNTIPSNRHADGIQFSLQQFGFKHDGIVAIIDSDLFFIRPISISSLLENHEIAAIVSPAFNNKLLNTNDHPARWTKIPGIEYLWPGAVFLKMNELPNKHDLDFFPGNFPHFTLDTGGWTYFYLKNNPQVRLYKLDEFYERLNTSYITVPQDLPPEQKIEAFQRLGFKETEIDFLLKRPHDLQLDYNVEFGFNNHFLHYHGGSYENSIYGHFTEDQVGKKSKWVREFMENLLQ